MRIQQIEYMHGMWTRNKVSLNIYGVKASSEGTRFETGCVGEYRVLVYRMWERK